MGANGAGGRAGAGGVDEKRGRFPLPPAYRPAARRSLRVTLAAGAGFYLFLYGFQEPVAATYALFAAVSLAGLSRIPGTGRQRATLLLRSLPATWLLVAAGTFLAVRTWSAVAGMLVIGFALAFVAVGGPRPAGAAPGLQLLYILPSFPPYAPDTLGERLIGTTVGILVLVLAEAFLLPEPPTVTYRELAARAAATAGRCAAELARPPYALSPETAAAAGAAAAALRPSHVPEAERPAGPGVRSRGLSHTGLAARTLLNRLVRLPAVPPGPDPPDLGLDVLRALGRSAEDSAARLRGAPGGEAAAALARQRARLADAPLRPAVPTSARRRADLLELADATLALAAAAGLAVEGRRAGTALPVGRFWYARMRAPQLWWRRLVGNAGSRSVFFQNAVRISLALAAARAIAGLATLPHGFWALLATLTLTRTTLEATRAGIRQALTGTLIGALCTAGFLALVGTDTTVYAAVMMPVLLVTFTVGPVKGVGWAQALFALTVSLVFAQLAPATWRLAEVRLLDVVIGSAIGVVFGLLAWPRGAHAEVRRSCAALLRSAAEGVVTTAATVAAGGVRDPAAPPGNTSLRRALVLAESAFAQYLSEPRGAVGSTSGAGSAGTRPPGTGPSASGPAIAVIPGAGGPAPDAPGPVDWQAVLLAGHHTLWGAERVLVPPVPPTGLPAPAVVPPLEPGEAAALMGLADEVAGRMLLLSAALDPREDSPGAQPPAPMPALSPRAPAGGAAATGPVSASTATGYYAADAWLEALLPDLDRITDDGPGRHAGR
ncbi:FUSC family protein [Streptomyces sp. NPDC008121]|uniref:FUSC family protein n=1 Tax=Streptomyces sp. NPDC008121 TaxID=3364809 RepID=UPI0036F106A1